MAINPLDRTTWESQTINGQWMQKDPSTGQWEIGYNPQDAQAWLSNWQQQQSYAPKPGDALYGRTAMGGNRYSMDLAGQQRVQDNLLSANPVQKDYTLSAMAQPGAFNAAQFPQMSQMVNQYLAGGGQAYKAPSLPAASNPTNYYNAVGSAAYQGAQQSAIDPSNPYYARTQAQQGTQNTQQGNPYSLNSFNADGSQKNQYPTTYVGGQSGTPTFGQNTGQTGQYPQTGQNTGQNFNNAFQQASTAVPTMQQSTPYGYNPQYWQQDTSTNPFIDSSGGFSYSGLPGMYNTLNQFYNQQMGDAAGKADALTDFMAANLTSSNPSDLANYIKSMVGTIGTAQGVSGLGGQQNAFDLLGNLASGNVGSTTPLQQQISSYIGSALGNGGISPELRQAFVETILQPSQENLVGQLNRMGGGQVAPSSGLQQELLRRNESDFNNYLLTQGFNNINNLLGQGTSSEASNFQNSLNTANSMGNLSQSALTNSLNSLNLGSNLYGTDLSALLGLHGNQQNYAGNMANNYSNLASGLMGYKTQYDTQQMMADALKNSSIGQSVSNITNNIDIDGILREIFGGGGGTSNPTSTPAPTEGPGTPGGTVTYPPTYPPTGGDTTPVPGGTSDTEITYGDYVPSPYDIANPLPQTPNSAYNENYSNPSVQDLIDMGLLPPNYNDYISNSGTTLGSYDWTLYNPTDWGYGIGGNLGSSTWPYMQGYGTDWGQYDTGINNTYWNGTAWVPYGY